MAKVLVVVPLFNESLRVHNVISIIDSVNLDFIFVDDGSIDGTKELLLKHNVEHINHEINQGQGRALITGMEYGLKYGYTHFIHFDGDGQHSVEGLKKVQSALVSGEYDIVFGSRFKNVESIKLIPITRRFILKVVVIFQQLLYRIYLSDAHCGLRGLSASAFKRMTLKYNRMAHASEYVSETKRLKLNYKEVEVNVIYSIDNSGKDAVWKRIKDIIQEIIKSYFKSMAKI